MRLAPIALVLLFSIVATAVRTAPPMVEPPTLDSNMVDLAKQIDDHTRAIGKIVKAGRTPMPHEEKLTKTRRKNLNRLAIQQAKSTLPINPNAPHQAQIGQLKTEVAGAKFRISKLSGGHNRYSAKDRRNSIAGTARDKARKKVYRAEIRKLAEESGIPHGLSDSSAPSSPPSSPEPAAKRAKPLPQPLPPSASGGSRTPSQPETGFSTDAQPFAPPDFNQYYHLGHPPTPPGFQTFPTYQLPLGPPAHQYGAPPTGSTTSHRAVGLATAPQPGFPTGGTFQPQPPQLSFNQPSGSPLAFHQPSGSPFGFNQPSNSPFGSPLPSSHAFSPPPPPYGGQTDPSSAQSFGFEHGFGHLSDDFGQSWNPSAPPTGSGRRTAGEGRAGTTATAHPFAPPGSPDLSELFDEDEFAKKYT